MGCVMFRFKSLRLRSSLQQLASQYRGKKIAARIVVPPNMSWWYYQEFGTATHNSGQSGSSENGITTQSVPASPHPDGYPIYPKNGKTLSWPTDAGGHYFDFVIGERGFRFFVPWHPGVSPQGFVRRVLLDVQAMAQDRIANALFTGNYQFEAAHSALVDEVMPAAINIIANSMGESLDGTRTDGKLSGAAAEQALRASASVEDLSK